MKFPESIFQEQQPLQFIAEVTAPDPETAIPAGKEIGLIIRNVLNHLQSPSRRSYQADTRREPVQIP